MNDEAVALEAGHYDSVYSNPDAPALASYELSPLKEMYDEVCRWLPSNAVVHDLGCGPGMLAEALLHHGHYNGDGAYRGIDFSDVAVRHGWARVEGVIDAMSDDAAAQMSWDFAFCTGDLREWQPPENLYNTVFVCLETLEHLDDDLSLIERIPAGRRLILSVPTFNSAAHVRWFPSLGMVWSRYEGLLRFQRWMRVGGDDDRGVVHLLDTTKRADAWEPA